MWRGGREEEEEKEKESDQENKPVLPVSVSEALPTHHCCKHHIVNPFCTMLHFSLSPPPHVKLEIRYFIDLTLLIHEAFLLSHVFDI